ncbi:MAG: hypothetical protein Q4G03_10910 [Planctomycetia bacterium]|nr:hypothetical protein [Planctomycetia bacterium]
MSNNSKITVKSYSKSFLTRKLLYLEDGTLKLYETPVSVTFEQLIEMFQRDKKITLDLKTGQAQPLPVAIVEQEVQSQCETDDVATQTDACENDSAELISDAEDTNVSKDADDTHEANVTEPNDDAPVDTNNHDEEPTSAQITNDTTETLCENSSDVEEQSDLASESTQNNDVQPPDTSGQSVATQASKTDDDATKKQE